MTPLEELQAAHKRLSELQRSAGHGPWTVRGASGIGCSEGCADIASQVYESDATLIVTLHRTIDAQLEFLAHAAGRACRYEPGPNATIVERQIRDVQPDALALARAINWEAS